MKLNTGSLMNNIHFTAEIGGSPQDVQIDNAFGAGGNTLHLLIDRRYRGIFLKRDTGWAWLPQNAAKYDLSPAHKALFIERILSAEEPLAV